MQDYKQDDLHKQTDDLETMTASAPQSIKPPADSPSSETDAGLDDEALNDEDVEAFDGDALDDLEDDPLDLDEGLPDTPPQEISISDLAAGPRAGELDSPELADLDTPGQIDIEGLAENALDDTDIPKDALLDPLED